MTSKAKQAVEAYTEQRKLNIVIRLLRRIVRIVLGPEYVMKFDATVARLQGMSREELEAEGQRLQRQLTTLRANPDQIGWVMHLGNHSVALYCFECAHVVQHFHELLRPVVRGKLDCGMNFDGKPCSVCGEALT